MMGKLSTVIVWTVVGVALVPVAVILAVCYLCSGCQWPENEA